MKKQKLVKKIAGVVCIVVGGITGAVFAYRGAKMIDTADKKEEENEEEVQVEVTEDDFEEE